MILVYITFYWWEYEKNHLNNCKGFYIYFSKDFDMWQENITYKLSKKIKTKKN